MPLETDTSGFLDSAGVDGGKVRARSRLGWARMARPRPIDPADHLGRPWGVHALARAEGLALHDIWEVDATLPPGATLAQWVEILRRERLGARTRALFALRWGLGRVLGLDRGSAGFTLVYARCRGDHPSPGHAPRR